MSVCVRVSAIESEDTTSQRPLYTTISAESVFAVPIAQPDSFVHTTVLENPQSVQDTILPPCDIVFYKTGKLEYCKILETSPTTISYKMCDYQDGPTIVVNKSDIHKIRYANGREDIVDSKQPNVTNAYSKGKKYPLATVSLIFGIVALGIIVLFGYAIPSLIIT
ncbi:MAG: hypothetical protein H7259_10010, partial [Cytophagales bacterium]|nr:hypothetical protein [Cytophaga sp.]